MNHTSQVTLNNTFLYNAASTLSDPLKHLDSTLLQFVAARVVISIAVFFAFYGLLNVLASSYVDHKDNQALDAMNKKSSMKSKKIVVSSTPQTQELSEKELQAVLDKVRLQMWGQEKLNEFHAKNQAG